MNREQKLWIKERIVHQGTLWTLPLFYLVRICCIFFQIYDVIKSRAPITLYANSEYFYISYNNNRENNVYEKFVPNSIVLGEVKKIGYMELLNTIGLSLINHFYYLPKVRRFILSERLLNYNLLKGNLRGKKFVAHDGANFVQRMLVIWCIKNRVISTRLIRNNTDCKTTMFQDTIYIAGRDLNVSVQSKINLKYPMFISNPRSSQIFGVEYCLFLYLLKRIALRKEFYIRHHPQVPTWKIKLCQLFFKKRVLNNTIPIENYQVNLLVQTYNSTIAILENVVHVKRI